MQTENNILIDDLLRRTEKSTDKVKQFEALTIDQLNQKKGNEWSILECLEHLNLYGDFYLVEIEKRIISGKNVSGFAKFKSGLLGNYFASLMEVKKWKDDKNEVAQRQESFEYSTFCYYHYKVSQTAGKTHCLTESVQND